jgi:hypothetical protein
MPEVEAGVANTGVAEPQCMGSAKFDEFSGLAPERPRRIRTNPVGFAQFVP